MSDFLPVLRVLGVLLTFFSLGLLLPWGVSWVHGDGLRHIWAIAAAGSFACGSALWVGMRAHKGELQARHGILLVALTWVLLPLFACVPLMLTLDSIGRPINFTHAYFEAVSGLTTSGSTVLTGLDTLPVSINFWRTFLQWLGGMGILVLAVAILPLLGVGGSQLFKAEVAGPIKDNKLTPRVKETAKGLW
ncbi:MAG: TrkH family potassium uptake protein, partial [Comamonadaceae bacterium]